MKQIDRANAVRSNVTNYADSASNNLVDSEKVKKDILDLLIVDPFIVNIQGVNSFYLEISAKGIFFIEWGDGNTETITKSDLSSTPYSHVYSAIGSYNIKISGKATEYAPASSGFAAIKMDYNSGIVNVQGSLGAIFGTVNGKNPIFRNTFKNCANLKSIPYNLFSGLTGDAEDHMFLGTFENCTNLTDALHPNLFKSSMSGKISKIMFSHTFSNCSKLTGNIPANLFGNLYGTPTNSMFSYTFSGCTGLTGMIPSGLFGNINGAPATYMFFYTFLNCSGLTGVQKDVFGKFSGMPATWMFFGTFSGCTGLNSIADGIWDISGVNDAAAAYMFDDMFYNCTSLNSASPSIKEGTGIKLWQHFTSIPTSTAFRNATAMSDYASIPSGWK